MSSAVKMLSTIGSPLSVENNQLSLLPNYTKVMILFSKVLSILCIYHLTHTAILDEAHQIHNCGLRLIGVTL